MKLRLYQKDNSESIVNILKDSHSVMYQLPTGGGKTIVIQDVVDKIVQGKAEHLGKKIIILVHRREIIFQIRARLKSQGIETGLLIGNLEENLDADILVASILTVTRDARLESILSKNYDFMIIDEAHHARSGSYDKVIESFKSHNPKWKLLGVTATPYRKDKKDLKAHFSNMLIGPTISELQQLGFLCNVKTYLTNLPDIDKKVIKSGGDYNITQLSKFMRDPKIIKHAVKAYKDIGENKQMLVFCVDKKHALSVKQAYIKAGYTKIAHIDSDTKTTERARIIQGFTDKTIDIITSIQTLTEGVDLPEAKVLQLLRPTLSLVLYLQMGGRGLRVKEDGSDLIILDVANVSKEHGLVPTNREWNLDNINPNIKTKRRKIVGKLKNGKVTDDLNEIETGKLELTELDPEQIFLLKENGLESAKESNQETINKAHTVYKELIKYVNTNFKYKGYKLVDEIEPLDMGEYWGEFKHIQFKTKNNKDKTFNAEYYKDASIKLNKDSHFWGYSVEMVDIENDNYIAMGRFAEFISKKIHKKKILGFWDDIFEIKEDMVVISDIKNQIRDFKIKQTEHTLNEIFAKGHFELILEETFGINNYNRNYSGWCKSIKFLGTPKKLKTSNVIKLDEARSYGYGYRGDGAILKTFKKEHILEIMLEKGFKNPLVETEN